ncbi:putative methyltransferase-domain-containing protein [Lactarius quietus]|nr:putative methyltransferase-domain-containing protein [Lactarius quietus]
MLDSIFPEPPRPPSPEPTIAVYERSVVDSTTPGTPWSTITVRLVGSHPLWGHYLWNAARSLARYLERLPTLYRGLTVLELGAGRPAGLAVAKSGARTAQVVLTDYPDQALVDNMAHNVAQNGVDAEVAVLGYVWGRPVEPLLAPLSSTTGAKFDLILLSDLVFNHSEHRGLLWTCEHAVAPRGCVLVFFTHHKPHLADRDLVFLDIARETGWTCDKVLTERFTPMFPDDMGEEEVRSTVHGWKLTRVGED